MNTTRSQDADSFRDHLIAHLKKSGVLKSPGVEAAMQTIPRLSFAPVGTNPEAAYENESISITDPQGKAVSSLSQPSMVVAMLEALALTPGLSVLEIGGGSGYNAALMAHLVGEHGRVVAVEIEPWLTQRAEQNLADLGVRNVEMVAGDGALGHAPAAPFDRIVATTATWEVFPAWFEQLVEGGHLLIPLEFGGDGERQSILVDLVRRGERLEGKVIKGSVFIPMRGARGGVRAEEVTEEGIGWRPTSSAALAQVVIYPKSTAVHPGNHEKLFEREFCKIVLSSS